MDLRNMWTFFFILFFLLSFYLFFGHLQYPLNACVEDLLKIYLTSTLLLYQSYDRDDS